MCDMCKDYISDPYPLSGGRIARVRRGQEAPDTSDLVVARGYILLPADPGGEGLHHNIRFGARLVIGGGGLNGMWGYTLRNDLLGELTPPGQWRFCSFTYKAQTWREAMTAAWEHAHAEIMKLEEALAQRQRALEEAECPEERQTQQVRRKIQVKGGQE